MSDKIEKAAIWFFQTGWKPLVITITVIGILLLIYGIARKIYESR